MEEQLQLADQKINQMAIDSSKEKKSNENISSQAKDLSNQLELEQEKTNHLLSEYNSLVDSYKYFLLVLFLLILLLLYLFLFPYSFFSSFSSFSFSFSFSSSFSSSSSPPPSPPPYPPPSPSPLTLKYYLALFPPKTKTCSMKSLNSTS